MKKDLLAMDRLPTLDELKELFKENDWTSTKIDDPSKRSDEERAEIAYAAKLMDKKFEELVRKKGRNSAARYYGQDNPLIALQNNTEDLVASTVVKIGCGGRTKNGQPFGLSFEGDAFKSRLVVPEKACGGLPPLFLAFFDHCGAAVSPCSALRRRHFSPNEQRSSFS